MPTVKHYKYKNIAAALAVLLIVILIISTSCNSGKNTGKKSKTVKPAASSSTVSSDSSGYKAEKLTGNYKYVTAKNKTDLVNGDLVLVNADHPFTGTAENTDTIYSYLFDKSGSQIMSTSSTNLAAQKKTFEAFNLMGCDFYSEKRLATLMVSTAMFTDDSSDDTEENTTATPCYEHDTGLAFDLHLYDASTGSYPQFTGEGDYSWIAENCWKYGFVLRYPSDKSDVTGVTPIPYHFRYVGIPHAEIMAANNLTLEEYVEFVKDYTFEKPLSFKAFDDTPYTVYYVEADDGSTTNIPIPLAESEAERPYAVSGNNVDGYIVCVDMTEGAAADSESSDVSDDTSSVSEKADAE